MRLSDKICLRHTRRRKIHPVLRIHVSFQLLPHAFIYTRNIVKLRIGLFIPGIKLAQHIRRDIQPLQLRHRLRNQRRHFLMPLQHAQGLQPYPFTVHHKAGRHAPSRRAHRSGFRPLHLFQYPADNARKAGDIHAHQATDPQLFHQHLLHGIGRLRGHNKKHVLQRVAVHHAFQSIDQ